MSHICRCRSTGSERGDNFQVMTCQESVHGDRNSVDCGDKITVPFVSAVALYDVIVSLNVAISGASIFQRRATLYLEQGCPAGTESLDAARSMLQL